MSVQKLPGVFTVSEAAELAKVSPWTIRQEIKLGNLRARRIGCCVRVLEPELARWLGDYGDEPT
jgi:excisionase family DNA binding protein